MDPIGEPAPAQAAIAAAQQLFAAKDYAAALEAFRMLRQHLPDDAHIADRTAHCHSLLHQWPQAREGWQNAIHRFGSNLNRVNALALCLLELRDYAAAAALLNAHRDQLTPNPNFHIYSAMAALGTGDAANAAKQAELAIALSAENQKASVDYLAGLLTRLASEGKGSQALSVIDHLLQQLGRNARILRAGVTISTALKRWPQRLRYAAALCQIEPEASEAWLHQLHALLELGRFDECQASLADVEQRFPKQQQLSGLDDRLAVIELRLSSSLLWQKALAQADDTQTFISLAFRTAAHLTLRQYEQAAASATLGLHAHHQHPWFMVLLGKAHEGLGHCDEAASWLRRAVERCPDRADYVLHLCRVLSDAGNKSEALPFAVNLARQYPGMPAARALLERLGTSNEMGDVQDAGVPPSARSRTWLHGGDTGDLIYALAAMQAGGGGQLYLSCVDGTREPMDERKIGFIAPLLLAQHYVEGVSPWQGENIGHDFVTLRHQFLRDVNLADQHWRYALDTEPNVRSAWLTVPEAAKHGRPVFARSLRYRNRNWQPLWQELKAGAPDAIFVGTQAEYEDFGHGEHVIARDALELAEVIAGASVFVGNQSLPYALAEGLKVGRLQETSTLAPNCVFPGALALRMDKPL